MSDKKNVRAVRELLGKHPDGLSVPEIASLTGIRATNINAVCRRNEAIYIDRWKVHTHADGAACCWVAVYCLVPRPPKPPKPSMKPGDYLRAMRAAEADGAR